MQEVLGWGDKDGEIGRVRKAFKYLGAWLSCEVNDSRMETTETPTAMQIAWSRLTGFVGSGEAGLRTKKMVFTSMPTSVAMSGRTALVPHQSDNDRLEKRRMRYASLLLGKHGSKHDFPAIQDKESDKCSTVASTHSSGEWVRHELDNTNNADIQCSQCTRFYHAQCPDPECKTKYCLVHMERREECGHQSCPLHEYCTACKHERGERNLSEWPGGITTHNAWTPTEIPFYTPMTTLMHTPRPEPAITPRVTLDLDDEWGDIEMELEQEASYERTQWTPPPIPTTWKKLRYYPDGSCPENKHARRRPAPAGWGCTIMGMEANASTEVLYIDMHGPVVCEPGPRWLGAERGFNNTGELSGVAEAMWYALMYGNRAIEHEIMTDSQYSIDVVTNKHAAKTNRTMIRFVQRLYKLARRFVKIGFTKVEGHSGLEGNERAGALAALGAVRYTTALGRWTDAVQPQLGEPKYSEYSITDGPGKEKYTGLR